MQSTHREYPRHAQTTALLACRIVDRNAQRSERLEFTIRRLSSEARERLIRLQASREEHPVDRTEKLERLKRTGRYIHIPPPPPRRFSPILEQYAADAEIRHRNEGQQPRQILCPPVFSFIESPDGALDVLEQLVSHCLDPDTRNIVIDQRQCQVMDLCANAAASILAIEARKKYNIGLSGNFPDDLEQRDIVTAAGLPRCLGFSVDNPPGFIHFNLTAGQKGSHSATSSNEAEIVTGTLAN